MGKIKREWQETEYVEKFFDPSTRKTRKAYVDFVSKGVRIIGYSPDDTVKYLTDFGLKETG